MEKIINCKRLIGALERVLYALEESRLIYILGENDDTTNKE